MVDFPLLDEVKLTRSTKWVDDFERVRKFFSTLNVFETEYAWDPSIDSSITPVIQYEWRVLSQKLGIEYVSNSQRVLSIGGGGNSPTLKYLSDSLEYLCVLNPSEQDLELYNEQIAQDKRILLVRGVGELIPFKDASFDLVEIPSALDHCFDHRKVLEESFRVLEPGGRIAITGGNSKSWYRELISKLELKITDVHHHHHTIHLEPNLLESVLISVGFKDVQCTTNYFLKFPKVIERMIWSPKILSIYGFVSNVFLSRVLGPEKGGMLLVGASK